MSGSGSLEDLSSVGGIAKFRLCITHLQSLGEGCEILRHIPAKIGGIIRVNRYTNPLLQHIEDVVLLHFRKDT